MKLETQKIIDTHHHLWDPTNGKYDWLIADGHEVFNKVYLYKEFEQDIANINLIKSVHVQAEINLSETIYETQWLQDHYNNQSLYDRKLPNAIIGFVDFLDIKVEQTLEQHLQYPNFRGIRQILNFDKKNKNISHATFDYLKNDLWVKNFELLKKFNLLFDLSILINQTEDAEKLIKKYDSTLFIINHTLCPHDITYENINLWLDKIKILSKYENVVIKLSGFGEFNSNWTTESIKPLILYSIENFGISRCMFGTNFPVDKFLSNASYEDYWKAYLKITQDFSEDEINNLFYKNAEKFYKI
ncbi:amidohydrolase family protein [Pelagibacteraceae bacterium]|nr:amidohydrolase family protein [Pelagibacteraceae bacterium]